jgi:hypothetical protein
MASVVDCAGGIDPALVLNDFGRGAVQLCARNGCVPALEVRGHSGCTATH